MKYSININQLAIINNNLDISLEDVVILDYLYWLFVSKNPKIKRIIGEDGLSYVWFDYVWFIKQNPLIRWKSKSTLTARLNNLKDKGFIKTIVSKDFIQRKYITVLDKIELMYGDDKFKNHNKKEFEIEECSWCGGDRFEIIDHHYPLQSSEGGKEVVRVCIFCHSFYHALSEELSAVERKRLTIENSNKYPVHVDEQDVHVDEQDPVHVDELIIDNNSNNSINNNTISDPNKSNKDTIKEKEEIQRIFEEYTKKILPGSRLTSKSRDKIKTRLREFNMEDILKGIDNFSKDNWWMEHNAFRGITWFFYSEDRTEQFKNLIPKGKASEEKEILREPKQRR
jgi:hypothetical protein